MNLKGKKLLYLGGTPRAKYVVERAQKLGIYVIVADYTKTNPAKEIADEAVFVNAVDVNALETYCLNNKVDGIISGYVDAILPCWRELCQRLNLPCYIEKSMLMAATDKNFFKELSRKYNVPVPQTYNIDIDKIKESANSLPYPIFVKPQDASGSRGADVCYDTEDFLRKYEYAMSFSSKKTVTIEEFLNGTEFILDYMIIDGEPHLASMADRYCVPGRPVAINSSDLMIFPSKHLDLYCREVEPYVVKMFKQEEYKNGVVFLQGYANPEIKFYETGCRLGGTWPYIDEYFHGINPMDMLFNHAITGTMLHGYDPSNIRADFKGYAAIIYFLSNKSEATIAKVVGMDEVESLPYVVHVMQHHPEGEHFSKGKMTDIRLSAVHLIADNFMQLKEHIKRVYGLVDYYDSEGNSLLAPLFDVEKLEGYE